MESFVNGTSAPVSTSSSTLATTSVQEFMLSKDFTSLVKRVRANSNGYPYITFINSKNEAENIYFSKNASNLVADGEEIAKGFFNPFRIAVTTNALGEERTKLVSQGEGMRTSIEDLF